MSVKSAERRRRRGSGFSKALLLLLLAAVTTIVAVSVFFRISTIKVVGNSKYTAEEVIAASGLEIGGNLFSIKDTSVAISLRKELPYVDKVKLVRNLPDSVTIEIEESYPLASLKTDDTVYIVNKSGKIIDETDETGALGTIELKGIEPIQPRVGEKIALGDAGAAQLGFLIETLTAIMSAGIEEDITYLDAGKTNSLVFDYKGRFTVKMDGNENAVAKVSLLVDAVSQLEPSDRGDIDISSENEARFVPG